MTYTGTITEAVPVIPDVAVPDFTITKLKVVNGQPSRAGNRLLASFTVSLPWMVIRGCVLLEDENGIVTAHGPRGNSGGHGIGTDLTDAALQRAITRRAGAIYTGYTGRELSDE